MSNVEFKIERGEIVAILGPNGAGKSSIMKSIVGIVDYEGEIRIDGVDANTKEAKNLFGYVPEEIKLIDHLTPEEFFSFLISIRGAGDDAVERVEKYVRAFGLDEYMDKPIISLSMGNKKNVTIVASLIHNPPYLLLDEPLNGLDAFSARVLKEIVARKSKDGGILLSTHIMEIAEKLSDRVIILNRGSKVAEGSLEELRNYGSLEEAFLKITVSMRVLRRLSPLYDLSHLVFVEAGLKNAAAIRQDVSRVTKVDQVQLHHREVIVYRSSLNFHRSGIL